MATYHQLNHEVGQKKIVVGSGSVNSGTTLQEAGHFPIGQDVTASGIPVVFPRFEGELPIVIHKEKESENRSDILGNIKAEPSVSLFNYTDDYALRNDIYISEIQGLNEVGEDGEESAKWAQLENVGTNYSPLPTGYIRHDEDRRAIKIELAKAEGGFQRVRIATRKRFRYQTGRVIRASVCLQMSLNDLPACEKTWGIGDAQDGFFFRIKADGQGDNFMLVHRRSSGDGLPKETVVTRSSFNGDKLDGLGGTGATLDFTQNAMYLVEWGWYGASSARFYAFVVDENKEVPKTVQGIPRGRWVMIHEMLIPDTLDAPSLGSPVLPFTIEVTNTGYLVEPQFIIKYGLSLQVDGGETDKAEIYGADMSAGRDIGPVLGGTLPSHYFPLFAIRSKDFAEGNLLNTQQGLPKALNLLANNATELAVFRDPVFSSIADNAGHFNGTLPADSEGGYGLAEALLEGPDGNNPNVRLLTEVPESLPLAVEDTYTATDMGTVEGNFLLKKVVTGKKLTTAFLPANKPEVLDLTHVYDLVREAVTTEYDSKFDFPVNNENIQVTNIDSGGILTVDRKHTFEPGFRFVIGARTFYVRSVLSVTTLTLSETRGGALYNNYAADGITAPFYGTGFYDLVISNAVASRARPIDQGIVVFAARRVVDSLSTTDLTEKNAEWMRLYNVSTSNTYNEVSPAPEVRAFLNYGLR